MKVPFTESKDGNRLLENQTFVDEVFDSLVIDPPWGSSATVSNTTFVNCRTSPGTCTIGPLATLNNVEFVDLDCGDAIHIDAAATLNQVTIRGSKPGSVLIKPKTDQEIPASDSIDWHLDLTEYQGEVVIVGLAADKIKKAANHVGVRSAWSESVDWKGLDIGPVSFFRLALRQIRNVDQGVFSLPAVGSSNFEQTMREKERLSAAGCVFD